MVSPTWIMLLLVLTVGFTIGNSVVEGIWFGGDTTNTISILVGTGADAGERLSAFWKIISFDYSFLVNEAIVLRYIFASIGIGTIFVLLWGAVSGLVGIVRRFG